MILRNNLIYNDDITIKYIELRICLLLDCEEKYKKITKIIDWLHENNYCTDLRLLYTQEIRSENIDEKISIPSISIDSRDNYLRFKYFDGEDVYWVYHTKDLLNLIQDKENNISKKIQKYQFMINILNDLQKKFSEDFISLSYDFPIEDEEEILFMLYLKEIPGMDIFKIILDLFFKEFYMCEESKQDDLKFIIKHKIVEEKKCTACEEARKRKEKNENGVVEE